MLSPLSRSDVYTDIQGLSELKRMADQRSPQAIKNAAQQFEALFIQHFLKTARESQLDEGLFDSDDSQFYHELYDKQLALLLSKNGQLGIASILEKQITSSLENARTEEHGSFSLVDKKSQSSQHNIFGKNTSSNVIQQINYSKKK